MRNGNLWKECFGSIRIETHVKDELGISPQTNRDFLFSVCREYPIFAPSKVILNVYDYETDSIFIQVTYVGDNDGMDIDEPSPEI
jgi:hypothetical protein